MNSLTLLYPQPLTRAQLQDRLHEVFGRVVLRGRDTPSVDGLGLSEGSSVRV